MKLRTKMLLGAPTMLALVMLVSTFFVFIIVFNQQKNATKDRLDTSFEIIRNEIRERNKTLEVAGAQIISSSDMGSKLQFSAEIWQNNSSMDFTLFRSDYLEMGQAVVGIASTAGIGDLILYNLLGEPMLGLADEGDNGYSLFFHHDKEHFGTARIDKGSKLTSTDWEEAAAVEPEKLIPFKGEMPGQVHHAIMVKNGLVHLSTAIPVMGGVYNEQMDDIIPKQFGLLVVMQALDQAFVEKMGQISNTKINIFLPNGLSRGGLPQYATQDLSSLSVSGANWSFEIQEILHESAKVGKDQYFQASLPLFIDSQCVGAITALIPTVEARKNTFYTVAGLILIFAICLAVMLPVSWFFSRSLTNPIHLVAQRLKDIAEGDGDLTGRLAITSEDEVGDLATSFNNFIGKIHAIVLRIKESSDALATSSSQISATSAELSTSSMETSTTVLELSTTAEEVKQTTNVANDKAEAVAQEAEATAQISMGGKQATEEAISGMKRIKEEMEYIAESIVKLSEHTQSIGEIIDAVNDLANESNLLSVNASIEAAKAGEYGKGFGVVAQEVKSLSDQSKQATAQVRAILNDIQNATSAAVMATERGAKAVDMGEALASRSGDAIRTLASSVTQASNSASQIAASSQQQLVGIAQLAQALDSITEASKQNTDGAKQLELATVQLHDLGQELKELSNRFRV